jgi:hypothetical protein
MDGNFKKNYVINRGRAPSEPTKFYQIQIYLKMKTFVKVKLGIFSKYEPEEIKIPCICEFISGTEAEANMFIPTYLERIISSKVLTEDQVYLNKEKNEINGDTIEIRIVPLTVISVNTDNEEGV